MASLLKVPRLAWADESTQSISGFQKRYVYLEEARNYPQMKTRDNFGAGNANYVIGIRQNVNYDWLMGLGGTFKSFTREADGDELAFFTLMHESYYIIRLYDPTYLLLGPKILYMLPARGSRLPIDGNPDYRREYGVSFAIMLVHHVSSRFMLEARLDRWRGTSTSYFQGLESAFGVSYALP